MILKLHIYNLLLASLKLSVNSLVSNSLMVFIFSSFYPETISYTCSGNILQLGGIGAWASIFVDYLKEFHWIS